MKSITLELKAPSEDGMFYRYSVDGKYNLWFVQHENGNIYSVSMTAKRDVPSEFEFYISDKTNDKFYPDTFTVRGRTGHMNAHDVAAYIQELSDVQDVLQSVQHFFETSDHALKYWSERVGEQMRNTNLGNYDLDGVEFTEDDCTNIAQRVVSGMTLESAMHTYLLEIRDVLDAGLDDIEEEL